MKTFFSLSLSFLVLLQSAGIGISDVFMLSNITEHIKYHSEEYGDDVFTFFNKHYGALKAEHNQTHDEEKSKHEKLPFQHNTSNHNLSEVVFIDSQFSLKKATVSYTAKHHFYYQDLYSFLERTSIFQPPKMA